MNVGSWTCKPNSVRGIAPAGRPFLWAAHYCAAQATYPEVVARRAGTRPSKLALRTGSLPIWSCSVWGLPCPLHYWSGGALLPHLFTLTPPFLSDLADVAKAQWNGGAVCFLWHLPSTDFEIGFPDVIRHTALWSSDFPPAFLDETRAAVRSSCLRSDYMRQGVTDRGNEVCAGEGTRTSIFCFGWTL